MTPKTAAMLCSIACKFDTAGRSYKAATYWFKAKFAQGFCRFAEREAMERWKYSGKIFEYVAKHNLPPLMSASPEINTGIWEGVNQVVAILRNHDDSIIKAVDGTIHQLLGAAGHHEVFFLSGLRGCFKEDLYEIKCIADQIDSDQHLTEIDSRLYERYGE